jgi:putative (di)nucleoside polyphosphate hydrolase
MKSPSQYFRAGAGAVIVDRRGLVLALERSDTPGAWQLPQGGLKPSESPLQAVFREVEEETGISKRDLHLLDAYPEPLAYELPADAWSKKTGRGQVGYWFLLRFAGTDGAVNLEGSSESRSWKWMRFERLVRAVVDFRKPLYRRLHERFRPHLAAGTGRRQRPPGRPGRVSVGTR